MSRSGSGRPGFTLLELVVVMALIAVLAVGIGWALRGGDDGARLRAAEVTITNYLQRARAEAVLRRQPVRVLLRDDDEEREHHWRQLGAVIRQETEDGEQGWLALDDGVHLPPGVYCWDAENDQSAWTGEMDLEFPVATVVSGGGAHWRFLTLLPSGAANEPGEIVLQLARWDPEASRPEARNDNGMQQTRLGLSRLGGLIVLEDSAEVPR